MSTRVVVVDDHAAVRRALVEMLEEEPGIEVCGAAGCIAEATALIAGQRPDVAVVDLSLGPEDGLDLVAALVRDQPRVAALVLSLQEAGAAEALAREAGARGFIAKERAGEDLAGAIRRLAPTGSCAAPGGASGDAGSPPGR